MNIVTLFEGIKKLCGIKTKRHLTVDKYLAEPAINISESGELNLAPEAPRPKIIIPEHMGKRMPAYQVYLDAVKGESTYRALLVEVVKSINANVATQSHCIEQLAAMGVIIQYESANPNTEDADEFTGQLTELPVHTYKSVKRRSREEMDRYIIEWGKSLRSRIEEGGRVQGTIKSWADELGITWLAVQSRITMLNDIVGLTFTDARGRSGSKARGSITIGLKRI